MATKKRLWLIRLLVVAALLAVCGVMMIIGRGHTVYFDNKTYDPEGVNIAAHQRIDVYVNSERVAKLNKRDRGMATWIGQRFTMKLVDTAKKGEEPQEITLSLALPYGWDGIVVNLPALLSKDPVIDKDQYLTEFVSVAPVEEEAEEPALTDEFGLGDF